ncbi:hypothetical protein [Bradyrhizobium sp. STM 3809]|uniref:hypothetical protein n=1 Tax=Bradyrhizobium sp. STM 3809 TaxID=551936 RepID=UPI0002409887|nr:hypothetical protein [Bradyrhizobium sp. STM 3809]CCE01788.1 conserved hypothetical protein [Bradyrhizobium sp. STM 3809]
MADIIEFATAATRIARAKRIDLAFEMAVVMQLMQLKRTLDAWRQILRRLDDLAKADGHAVPDEQSRPIRQLIADAERAISDMNDRADAAAPADDPHPRDA